MAHTRKTIRVKLHQRSSAIIHEAGCRSDTLYSDLIVCLADGRLIPLLLSTGNSHCLAYILGRCITCNYLGHNNTLSCPLERKLI
ncbi:hypothetical protein C0J52_00422 [Blattella germanica]|nr:hypothetical protein C0J52_00422 [Blattella germanica]